MAFVDLLLFLTTRPLFLASVINYTCMLWSTSGLGNRVNDSCVLKVQVDSFQDTVSEDFSF